MRAIQAGFIILILILINTTACKKKDKNNTKDVGSITVTMNGIHWTASNIYAQMWKDGRPYIIADIQLPNGYTQTFSIDNFKFISDTQKVYDKTNWTVYDQSGTKRSNDTCTGNLTISDHDVLLSGYNVMEEENNYMIIDHYYNDQQNVSGRFQLTFVESRYHDTTLHPNPPDTVRLTNGRIYLNFTQLTE